MVHGLRVHWTHRLTTPGANSCCALLLQSHACLTWLSSGSSIGLYRLLLLLLFGGCFWLLVLLCLLCLLVRLLFVRWHRLLRLPWLQLLLHVLCLLL